jgi:hypothetical protein
VPLVDEELDPLLTSGEVTAPGTGDVAAAADLVAGAGALLPLVQLASNTIKPLVTIKQALWNPMLAPTRRQVARCATVMQLGSYERKSAKWLLKRVDKDSRRSRPFSAVASEGRPITPDDE